MEREPTERTENPLFSPLAPVQLSLSRGRHALSGALQQRAGPLLAIGYRLSAIRYALCAMRYAGAYNWSNRSQNCSLLS